MKMMSIGEVSKRTGVAASALRYYEDAGILPAPQRAGGRRLYGADAIRRVDVLRFAQQVGFTLEEIRTLFNGFGDETALSARWEPLARAKLAELDMLSKRIRKMKRALELGMKCRCVRVEDCSLSPRDIETVKPRAGRSCCG
jgi:MerR family redox-sensitive transcriptional activator SoxR